MPRARQKQRKASKLWSATTSCARHAGYTGSNDPDIVSAPMVGDRVTVRRGHKDILFAGANGTIICLAREHSMLVATVRLDRKTGSGRRISIRKPLMELDLLGPGEWRLPRVYDPRPEHQTVYGTIWG